MTKRFELIEELVRTDKQGEEVQAKDNSKDLFSIAGTSQSQR